MTLVSVFWISKIFQVKRSLWGIQLFQIIFWTQTNFNSTFRRRRQGNSVIIFEHFIFDVITQISRMSVSLISNIFQVSLSDYGILNYFTFGSIGLLIDWFLTLLHAYHSQFNNNWENPGKIIDFSLELHILFFHSHDTYAAFTVFEYISTVYATATK